MVWRDQKLSFVGCSWPKFHVCGNRIAWGNEGVKRGAVAVYPMIFCNHEINMAAMWVEGVVVYPKALYKIQPVSDRLIIRPFF